MDQSKYTELVVDLRLTSRDAKPNLDVRVKMGASTDGKFVIVEDNNDQLVKLLRSERLLFSPSDGELQDELIAEVFSKIELQWSGALEPGNLLWLYYPESGVLLWDGVVTVMHTTVQRLSLPAEMYSGR